MRILVHDYAGHPFQVQLSRALASRGHEVLHLYAGQLQTPRGALVKRSEDPDAFNVRPVDLGESITKYNFVKRRGQELRYGKLAAAEVLRFQPDVVVSSNTNIDAQRILLRATRRADARFVFWLQDVLGIGAERILGEKYGIAGRAIGKYYSAIERRLLRESDAVVAITEDFRPHLKAWGISPGRIHVVPNWAPLEEMPPRARDNSWAREHDLLAKTVFLYSGTLGLKHNPELLVQLALRHQGDPQVRVVVISEGLGADHIRKRVAEHSLRNVLQLPYQPFERLPDVLGSADVLVAILEPGAGIFSVPSKVLSYHCAGRALLLAVPLENLAARIATENATGHVVHPNDAASFLSKAAELAADASTREKFGRNARAYAEFTFDIGAITDRFEKILSP